MKEIDENDVEQLKNNNTINIAAYKALKGKKDEFLSITSKKHDSVKEMCFALNYIADKYDDIVESKNQLHNEEAKKNKARVSEMIPEIKKFTKAVKDVQEAGYQLYGDDDSDDVQNELNTIAAFQSFLADGEGITNFQKILNDIKADRKLDKKYKAGFINGLSVLDEAFDCGLNPEELETIKAKEIKKEEKKPEKKDEGIKIEDDYNEYLNSKEYKDIQSSKDALHWVDYLKNEYGRNPNSFKSKPEYPDNFLTSIIAVRDIAGAERNEPSTLRRGGLISQSDIDGRIVTLKQNAHFANWLAEFKRDPAYLAKAESAATVTFGHGGKVEDMFKKYLMKQPAGALEYDPTIARLMPTVKERIEGLQDQIKNGKKNDPEFVATAAAEILLLRNKIKCERDKKSSLNVKCPCDDQQFNEKIKALAEQDTFKLMLQNPRILSQITEGHGGEMIDRMRTEFMDNSYSSVSVSQPLMEGTVDGRLEMIKNEVLQIRDDFGGSKNPTVQQKDNAKKIIAEYASLASLKVKKNYKGSDNVPRGTVNSFIDNAVNHDRNFTQLFDIDNAYSDVMNDIQTMKEGKFVSTFDKRMTGAKIKNDEMNQEVLRSLAGEDKVQGKKIDDDIFKPVDADKLGDKVEMKNGKVQVKGKAKGK
ncbi:MAG: hypothetical protein K5659_01605 [Lachnospiraceae bacterium]|nr:hypothetical protein [Lachnospiraceae bacterium]